MTLETNYCSIQKDINTNELYLKYKNNNDFYKKHNKDNFYNTFINYIIKFTKEEEHFQVNDLDNVINKYDKVFFEEDFYEKLKNEKKLFYFEVKTKINNKEERIIYEARNKNDIIKNLKKISKNKNFSINEFSDIKLIKDINKINKDSFLNRSIDYKYFDKQVEIFQKLSKNIKIKDLDNKDVKNLKKDIDYIINESYEQFRHNKKNVISKINELLNQKSKEIKTI